MTQPGPENRGREVLTAAARDVLKKFQVHDDSYELRGGGGRLPEAVSRKILQTGQRLSRLSCDLEFIAPPEVAMDVIGYLESYEDIEAISDVRITKDSNRQVKVRLTLEAWVEAPPRRR